MAHRFVVRTPIVLDGVVRPRVPEDWELVLVMSGESERGLRALQLTSEQRELDVRFLVASLPTQAFKGKLSLDEFCVEEGCKTISVRIHPVNDDIPAEYRVPNGLLKNDIEVRVRVR